MVVADDQTVVREGPAITLGLLDDVSGWARRPMPRGYLTKDPDASRSRRRSGRWPPASPHWIPGAAAAARRERRTPAGQPDDSGWRPGPPAGRESRRTGAPTDRGGLSNREIADRLFVTEATVKSHINRLFAKARIRGRAVRYAYRHGLAG